jgi:hypothetical protein
LSVNASGQSRVGIFDPRQLLRAIAGAVANAQHEIDAYQRALILDAPKMAANVSLESIAAPFPFRKYQIAELVLEYTTEKTDEGLHRRNTVLFRVASSGRPAEFVAQLAIDGKPKEALVISLQPFGRRV